MALKLYKPITPGMRGRIDLMRDEITAQKPEKSLTTGKKSNAGRDSNGRISVRHQGGGHKRKYREIDFKRNKYGIPGTVRTIEYDPSYTSVKVAIVSGGYHTSPFTLTSSVDLRERKPETFSRRRALGCRYGND